ncbi:MAG: NTE family protein [Bradymonadia bacterium]
MLAHVRVRLRMSMPATRSARRSADKPRPTAHDEDMTRPKTGLVLSGGGARGAYGVGVLLGLTEVLGLGPDDPAPFQVFTGASVGAINTAFLAAHAHRGDMGTAALARLWSDLKLPVHLRVDPLRLVGARRLLSRLRGQPMMGTSLLDTSALEALVRDAVPWQQLHRNVREGRVDALIIAALRIATGRTCMFYDTSDACTFKPSRDPRRVSQAGPITAEHVLASSAIPVVFPSRQIGNNWYCDGGIRFNTPIAPAIRAGADRLMVISLMHEGAAPEAAAVAAEENYPNPLFLIGKVLNALLLDPIAYDLQVLKRFNRMMEVLDTTLADDVRARIDTVVTSARGQPYRKLDALVFQPSKDLGRLAGEHLRDNVDRLGLGFIARWLLKHAGRRGATWEDDIASYILFDGAFARRLIQIGRDDAHDRADEIRGFFAE